VTARFTGFPVEAFEFYDALAAENTKAFWAAHKDDYQRHVRDPLQLLMTELEPEFGAAHLFRPYRDVRFSKDKVPYKDHQGAFCGAEDGVGWYVQVSRTGLMVAGGWWSSSSLQVQRFRDAVDSPVATGLESGIAAATKAGFTVGGDVMKTRPRGIDPDHPRLDLLRHRSLTVDTQVGTPAWASTRTAFTKVRGLWRSITPLVEWLADHVGPHDDGIPAEPR
jgi:uncharacterized protein (TIGR02453 family)